MIEHPITQYFSYWRTYALGTREIVEARVQDAHANPSRELAAALTGWDGYAYWENTPEARWLVLVHETARRRERWWLHLALLLVTLISMSIGGAALAGKLGSWWHFPLPTLAAGFAFSLPLLGIFLAHESGHYVAARRYRVDASPPYFIPFPAELNIFGTMGAFIRLRSYIFDRRTLFDIGIAGPLAGVAVAIPVLAVGLALSVPAPIAPYGPMSHQVIMIGGVVLGVGDSLLMMMLRTLVGAHGVLMLHPIAVAGWVGGFITMLNLLPLAQLDGGHVTYALFGARQRWIALAFWLVLLPLGHLWNGWWVWAALSLVIGRGQVAHPRVVAPERALSGGRRLLGYAAIIIFFVTFVPVPLIVR